MILAACAGPSKATRSDLKDAQATTDGADAGGRTGDPKNPSSRPGPTSGVPAVAGQPVPEGTGSNPVTGKPSVTGGVAAAGSGKCALPAEQRTGAHCGPYSPERRILCYSFASNKETCIADIPPDGIEKQLYERTGDHLVIHVTTPGTYPKRSPAGSDCQTAKVISAFKIVRLLAEPSESAAEVTATLARSQDTFTIAQIWGYWSKVSGGGKEGWIVSRALACQ